MALNQIAGLPQDLVPVVNQRTVNASRAAPAEDVGELLAKPVERGVDAGVELLPAALVRIFADLGKLRLQLGNLAPHVADAADDRGPLADAQLAEAVAVLVEKRVEVYRVKLVALGRPAVG